MTIPCANCGAAIAADQYRCPTCDALAPVDETAVAPLHETDGPAGEQPGTVPWAIPIRPGDGDGARTGARPKARSRDPLRLAVYGVLAVALLAGVLAVVGGLLGDDGETESASESDPNVMGDVVDGDDPTTTSDADRTTSTTASPSSTTSSTTSTTSTTTTDPPAATTPPATAPRSTTTASAPPAPATATPGSAPVLSPAFRGGWIAQLTSVPASTGEAAIEAAWSEARSTAPGAVVTRSDHWNSFAPGFWVVVAPGPFRDVEEARAYCATIPDTRTDCLPRQLTGRR